MLTSYPRYGGNGTKINKVRVLKGVQQRGELVRQPGRGKGGASTSTYQHFLVKVKSQPLVNLTASIKIVDFW